MDVHPCPPGDRVILLPLACTATDPAPVDTATGFVGVQPKWSAEDALWALDTLGPPPSASDVLDTYLALLAAGDAACPGSSTRIGGASLQGCTSSTGYSYAGISSYSPAAGGWILTGDFDIHTPDDARFVGGGAINVNTDGMGTWQAGWSGTWSFEAADDWMATGVSTWWSQRGGTHAGVDWVTLDQGLGYGQDLWFEALSRDTSLCDGLSGVVEIRDPSGGWWRLDHGTCGACGALSFEGEDHGEACSSLAIWLDGMGP